MIWVQTVLNGIFLGALYGLLGLGLALVFGVVRIVNIAHGEFIVLAAFLALGLGDLFPGVSPLVMLVPDLIIAFAFGYILQALLINRVVASPDPTVPMLLAFGISFALRNLMVELFGVDLHTLGSGNLSSAGLEVGSSRVDLQACKLEYSIVSPK